MWNFFQKVAYKAKKFAQLEKLAVLPPARPHLPSLRPASPNTPVWREGWDGQCLPVIKGDSRVYYSNDYIAFIFILVLQIVDVQGMINIFVINYIESYYFIDLNIMESIKATITPESAKWVWLDQPYINW